MVQESWRREGQDKVLCALSVTDEEETVTPSRLSTTINSAICSMFCWLLTFSGGQNGLDRWHGHDKQHISPSKLLAHFTWFCTDSEKYNHSIWFVLRRDIGKWMSENKATCYVSSFWCCSMVCINESATACMVSAPFFQQCCVSITHRKGSVWQCEDADTTQPWTESHSGD